GDRRVAERSARRERPEAVVDLLIEIDREADDRDAVLDRNRGTHDLRRRDRAPALLSGGDPRRRLAPRARDVTRPDREPVAAAEPRYVSIARAGERERIERDRPSVPAGDHEVFVELADPGHPRDAERAVPHICARRAEAHGEDVVASAH